ncbi:hypothetical protein [uncultured Cytophaga sp.]|nr:hypothetical protein [uncultured Cytophaga sp.]
MNVPTFSFKEIDQEGIETLSVIAHADKLNTWFLIQLNHFVLEKY